MKQCILQLIIKTPTFSKKHLETTQSNVLNFPKLKKINDAENVFRRLNDKIAFNVARIGYCYAVLEKIILPIGVNSNKIDTTPEHIIAAISLHALIRHQNHLKIKIEPVPAPNIKII